ncbi:MAG: 50S ribosomal protein L9 [Anaerolineae bacterium]|nr:MAG: 50S ribosomal protein L9 [Anaerolineae bacterium]
MEVLLIQDVAGVGKAGEIKRVADGYGRNYLIPKGLAVLSRPGLVRQAEEQRQAREKRVTRETADARVLAGRMAQMTLTFQAKAGEQEKLYGSITSGDIVEELAKQLGQEIDLRKVLLDQPIKQLGSHQVAVRLATDVIADLTVVVEREE